MKGGKIRLLYFLEEKTWVVLCFLLQYKDARKKKISGEVERGKLTAHAVGRTA